MSEHRSGSRNLPGPGGRHRRLAHLPTDPAVGAAVFGVALPDPARIGQSPHTHRTAGGQIGLDPAQAATAARRIVPMLRGTTWGDAYRPDLTTARLFRAVSAAAGRGR